MILYCEGQGVFTVRGCVFKGADYVVECLSVSSSVGSFRRRRVLLGLLPRRNICGSLVSPSVSLPRPTVPVGTGAVVVDDPPAASCASMSSVPLSVVLSSSRVSRFRIILFSLSKVGRQLALLSHGPVSGLVHILNEAARELVCQLFTGSLEE